MLPPGWFYPFVAVFVVIMAVALIMQFAMLGAIFALARKAQQMAQKLIQEEVRPLMRDEIRPLLEEAKPMLKEGREQFHRLTETLNRVEDSAKKHIAEADQVITDATRRADTLVDHTMQRAENVERAVTWPFRLVRALAHAITSGVGYLLNPEPTKLRPEFREHRIEEEVILREEPPRRVA